MSKLPPLLPERHPQRDFFIADIFDSLPFKDDMATMEHPLFSLSTKPDKRALTYTQAGSTIEIQPSYWGLPTIFDKDVLLYVCLLYTSPSPRDRTRSRMPSSA